MLPDSSTTRSIDSAVVEFEFLRKLAVAEDRKLYGLLDACDQPLVPILARQLQERAVSLYRGQAERDHADIAPYLVDIDATVLEWVHAELWHDAWGCFVASTTDLATLRKHFRRFLKVEGPETKDLYFRFYDPRVLQPFLESASTTTVCQFFGPIDTFYIVSADQQIIELKRCQHNATMPTTTGKLKFTAADMHALAHTRRIAFQNRLTQHIAQKLLAMGNIVRTQELAVQVSQGIQRALTYEMNGQRDIARYVELTCLHLGGFEKDHDPLAVQNILLDRRVDFSVRLDRLEALANP